MIAPYFPSILVPIIGIFLPGIAMAALFIYIEKESVEWLYTQHFFFSFIKKNLILNKNQKEILLK